MNIDGENMEETANLMKHLMRTGAFKTNREVLNYLVLKAIAEHDAPMGSWTLVQLLANQNISISSATVGRYLKDLDYAGYTVRESNQGRIITGEGKIFLGSLLEQIERTEVHDEVTQALCVNEYDELSDLIKTRKVLEVAAIQQAVKNACESDIQKLRESTKDYYSDLAEKVDHIEPALDFHSIIAKMSGNKYYISLLEMLLYEEKQVEARLDVLETRYQGDIYVAQHEQITKAIEAHDGKLAVKLMSDHMDLILKTVEQQIAVIKSSGRNSDKV